MRQLAAIMFSDMTGYTALMQQNEQLAKDKRRRLKEVLEISVAGYHGKILQYYGDGALSIFNSAVDGVNCAVKIQQSLQQEPKVELRIGIHTGDISIEDEVIYGDGVNLASRIESLAVPGSIFISEKVFDEIRNQENLTAREMGYFELKNVKKPVRIFAIDNKGLVVPNRSALKGKTKQPSNRLAVLPFVNMSADPENYYRNLTDIFEVQDEISSIIANKLRENLTEKEHGETLVKVPTQNLEAYTLFLKGLHFHNKITPKYTKKAIECFEKAITLEPGYANAYAMAAVGYAFLGATGQMQPNEAFEVVHKYSNEAIKLDSSLAVGYVAKGSAYLLYDWKWKQAHDSLLKAIELNPATTEAHQLLCFYYMITGRKKDAIEIMEKALQADPLSPRVIQLLAETYLNAGRPDDALKHAESLLEIYPNMRVASELKGWCISAKGDWKKAAEIFEEVHQLIKNPLKGLTPLGCAYAKLGNTEKALECIRKIEQRQVNEPGAVLDIDLAIIWWALGDKEKTFYHLFQCVEKRIGPVAILIDHPLFKGLSD